MAHTAQATRRFVVLRHDVPPGAARSSHWDFMLDIGAALRTWALASEPAVGVPISAQALADHRLAYLDYQGAVSGDRGTVSQWDAGQYSVIEESPGLVVLNLAGKRLHGQVRMTRQEPSADHWTFCFSSGRAATSV